MATNVYCAIAAFAYLSINSTIVSFFIAITLYFHALSKHFAILVKNIDKPPIEIENLDNPLPPAVIKHKKEIHAKQMHRKIIQFHIFAKE